MATATVLGYDATTYNESRLPKGQAAGYDTGSGIAWTGAQWAAHPGALHIDQEPYGTDATADYFDVENGAGRISDVASWAEKALAAFRAGKRPGQRSPAVYCSASNVTPVANALVAGRVKSGVGLVVANWNLSQAQAQAEVAAGSGPYPVVGVQFHDAGLYDINVFSVNWLNTVSEGPQAQNLWTYPAPSGLKVTKITGDGYNLAWDAVKGPKGQAPSGYTVQTFLIGTRSATQVNEHTCTGTSTSEYGKAGSGLPAGEYASHVWGNDAPVGPPHASVTLTLSK
jgi:hypothetical protein